jgi:hypothetical protein
MAVTFLLRFNYVVYKFDTSRQGRECVYHIAYFVCTDL